mgnify:CR=1 FL=1
MDFELKYQTLSTLIQKLLAAQEDAKNNRTVQSKQIAVKRIENEILAEINNKPTASQSTMEWWGK